MDFIFPTSPGQINDEVAQSQGTKIPNKVPLSAEDVNKLLEGAKSALANSEINRAIELLTDVLDNQEDHQEAYSLLGAVLLSLGRFEIAEGLLYKAVHLSHWQDTNAVVNLATVLRQTNESELALKVLVKAYDKIKESKAMSTTAEGVTIETPDTADIAVKDKQSLALGIADTYFALGNYSAASEWYLGGALMDATSTNAPYMWIQASTIRYPKEARDLKFAENVLLQANQEVKDNAELIFHLGVVMFETKRVTEAITFYEQAIRLQREYSEAIGALATAFHSIREYDEAMYYYKIAVAMTPDNVVLLSNFAILLNSLEGQRTDAVAVLSRAYELQPKHPDVLKAMKELGIELEDE